MDDGVMDTQQEVAAAELADAEARAAEADRQADEQHAGDHPRQTKPDLR